MQGAKLPQCRWRRRAVSSRLIPYHSHTASLRCRVSPPPRQGPTNVTTAVDLLPDTSHERPPTKPPKLNTAAFKAVPETRELRDAIRSAVQAYSRMVDKSKPLTREFTKETATAILKPLGLG